MSDGNTQVPDYLQSTYQMLECAFPNGVEPEDYFPLLALLSAGMNFRGMAEIISLFMQRDYAFTSNDALRVESTDVPDPESVERVLQRLLACGYGEWLAESDV